MLYAGAVLHRLLPFEVESLGGIPTAGLPLLGAVLSQCALLDGSIRPRSGFYTRATPKSHGLGQQVEGMPKGVACLIEDTITTAGSAIEHALIARENGVDVRYVACLFDRQEGGVQALQEHGISLLAAYRADQFL
jgi:orotate phosphoribosyltransferase